MKKILISFLIFFFIVPLLGTGCSKIQANESTYTYFITIETSPDKADIRMVALNYEKMDMKKLMGEAGIKLNIVQQENISVVTELNGIISTLSKEWHLYINSALHRFNDLETISVQASDTIEWKYEKRTT